MSFDFDQFFYMTARVRSGSLSKNFNIATAFHYELPSSQSNDGGPYLVTNAHVLEGCEKLTVEFAKAELTTRQVVPGEMVLGEVSGPQFIWYRHEDANVDVAAVPVAEMLATL